MILNTMLTLLGTGLVFAALIALCEAQYRKLQSRGKQAEWDHVERRQWGRQALPLMPTRPTTPEERIALHQRRVAEKIREDALAPYERDGRAG